MQTRREMLARSATVAGLLASAGFLPLPALAAWPKAAFDAKTMADAAKALGGSAPVESKDVSVSGPDIAENGAVVPVGCATTLPGALSLLAGTLHVKGPPARPETAMRLSGGRRPPRFAASRAR